MNDPSFTGTPVQVGRSQKTESSRTPHQSPLKSIPEFQDSARQGPHSRTVSAAAPPLFDEPVYTLAQLAAELQLSHERTRKLFEHEPGVIVIAGPGEGSGYSAGRKRSKARNTYRVPRSVAVRVVNRMRNVPRLSLRECA